MQRPNHQSSSTLETDDVGAVISYEEYHPFGTTSYQAMEKPVRAAAKRYRYTGMERDDETGLSYHSARYYISWLGRWLSPDPIGIGDGVNVYGYWHNNPVTNTDTEGTQVNVTKQDNTKVIPRIDFKGLIESGQKQAAADIAAKSAAYNKLLSDMANRDKLFGTMDEEYHLTEGNYNPDMAKLASTKKVAEKEKGAMKVFVWAGYTLDKVGEYGSAAIAAKSTSGNKSDISPTIRETNFNAPIDGQTPIKTKLLVSTPKPRTTSKKKATPFINGDLIAKEKAIIETSQLSKKSKSTSKTENLNSNDAISNYVIYRIRIDGKLYKYGKADIDRLTKSSGLPTRLHQQLRVLREKNPDSLIEGEVIESLGKTTTKHAKEIENSYLQNFFNENGYVPEGNINSFKPIIPK